MGEPDVAKPPSARQIFKRARASGEFPDLNDQELRKLVNEAVASRIDFEQEESVLSELERALGRDRAAGLIHVVTGGRRVERFVDARELGPCVGLAPEKIRRLARAGQIRGAVKLRGRWAFQVSQVIGVRAPRCMRVRAARLPKPSRPPATTARRARTRRRRTIRTASRGDPSPADLETAARPSLSSDRRTFSPSRGDRQSARAT
jgi:hypothetical protein